MATLSVESDHLTSPDPNQKTIPVTSQCFTSSSKINPLVSDLNLHHQHTHLYVSSPSNPFHPPSSEGTVCPPPPPSRTDTFCTNCLHRDTLRRPGFGHLVARMQRNGICFFRDRRRIPRMRRYTMIGKSGLCG